MDKTLVIIDIRKVSAGVLSTHTELNLTTCGCHEKVTDGPEREAFFHSIPALIVAIMVC
jgi:hypothetical protein